MKFPYVLLVGSVFLAGCNTTFTGYDFKIQAVYEAPVSKLRVTINADGAVPAGADTSETYQGTVFIDPLSPTGKKVELTFADDLDQVTYAIDSGTAAVAKWGWRDAETSLSIILTKSEYSALDAAELAEIARVIGGAFGGPKTVTLDGQSQRLKVINVNLTR